MTTIFISMLYIKKENPVNIECRIPSVAQSTKPPYVVLHTEMFIRAFPYPLPMNRLWSIYKIGTNQQTKHPYSCRRVIYSLLSFNMQSH